MPIDDTGRPKSGPLGGILNVPAPIRLPPLVQVINNPGALPDVSQDGAEFQLEGEDGDFEAAMMGGAVVPNEEVDMEAEWETLEEEFLGGP